MDGDWWVNARVAPRWSSDGRVIAYLAPGEHGSTLWLINPDGRSALPTQVSDVLRFDWHLDSRRAIRTTARVGGSRSSRPTSTPGSPPEGERHDRECDAIDIC